MENLYKQMISSLTAAAANVGNVPTPKEFAKNLSQLLPKGSMIFRSIAMVDVVQGINHLNQFIDDNQVKLSFEDEELRQNIVSSALLLRQNESENISKINYIVENTKGVRPDGSVIDLQPIIENIIKEIDHYSSLLSE